MILTYVSYHPTLDFPHIIQYPDGSYGSRLDNGNVFKNHRLPEDHDIVEILA
jgi:hypothetical protein